MTPASARRTVYISRRSSFCAAHRYHNPSWTDERNREVFGACNLPHGHGHNYELEVTVAGEVDPETGMVLNLREIDAIVEREVIARLDHRHLNEDLPEWRERIPTTENLVVDLWDRLEPEFRRPRCRLRRLRLFESPTLFSEYYGAGSYFGAGSGALEPDAAGRDGSGRSLPPAGGG